MRERSPGGDVLFVGTKKQAQETVAEEAARGRHALREPALARRHAHELPTIQRRIERLRELEDMGTRGDIRARCPRRSRRSSTKKDKLDEVLSAASRTWTPARAPSTSSTRVKEHIAVAEAASWASRSSRSCDTNCDPDQVDYSIPGNDDAIRAVRLITDRVANACIEGVEVAPKTTCPRTRPPKRKTGEKPGSTSGRSRRYRRGDGARRGP